MPTSNFSQYLCILFATIPVVPITIGIISVCVFLIAILLSLINDIYLVFLFLSALCFIIIYIILAVARGFTRMLGELLHVFE